MQSTPDINPVEIHRLYETSSKLKKLLAASAIYLSFTTGGAIDRIGDEMTHAEDVVVSAIPVPEKQIFEANDTLDSIPFEDYPIQSQNEMRAEADKSYELDIAARTSLIELFDRIDNEGSGAAQEVAEKYRAEHEEDFIGAAESVAVQESIENATTNEQVVESLDEFMESYGIRAGFLSDSLDVAEPYGADVDATKKLASAYVHVFSPLPKSFVELAGLEKVTLSTESATDASMGIEAGVYSPSTNEINIKIVSDKMRLAVAVEGSLTGTDMSYESAIAHELGHALSEKTRAMSSLQETEVMGDSIGTAVFSQMARNSLLVNRPEVPSAYSRTDSGEYTAELMSGLLSDRKDGLAPPEAWRQFSSESNKSMLEMLYKLEKLRPGIAAVLVSNRLNSNEALE